MEAGLPKSQPCAYSTPRSVRSGPGPRSPRFQRRSGDGASACDFTFCLYARGRLPGAVRLRSCQANGLSTINTQLRTQVTKDSQLPWCELDEVDRVYGPVPLSRLAGVAEAAQELADEPDEAARAFDETVHLELELRPPRLAEATSSKPRPSSFQPPSGTSAVFPDAGHQRNGRGPGAVVEPLQPRGRGTRVGVVGVAVAASDRR